MLGKAGSVVESINLTSLVTLQQLKLNGISSFQLHDSALSKLTGLTGLCLNMCVCITADDLSSLTNFRKMKISHGELVTDSAFEKLTNLQSLELMDCPKVSGSFLPSLCLLRFFQTDILVRQVYMAALPSNSEV